MKTFIGKLLTLNSLQWLSYRNLALQRALLKTIA